MTNFVNPEHSFLSSGRNLVRWLRRLATRIFLVQVHAELSEMRERQDRLERQLHTLLGRHYDNLAVSSRLAALEDHVRELQQTSAIEDESELPRKG